MAQLPLPADLRARSLRLAYGLTWLLVALTLLLLLERFSAVVVQIVHGDASAPAQQLGLALARAVPEVCFLLALWWVRRALLEFAGGAFHTPVIARALQGVGYVLTLGAALKVLVLPSVERLLGSPPGYVIAYDVGSLVLCAIGLALAMLAHVLARAAAVQAELDEIF